MKIALVSNVVPPSRTGQGVILYRMLSGLPADDYCLVSTERYEPGGEAQPRTLPARYHHLPPPPPEIRRGHRFGLRYLRDGANLWAAARHYARHIGRVVREEGCGAVVACTGELTLMPAAYLAARRAGVPFYPYIFDHFSYREAWSETRSFWARRMEPRLMRGAERVIVLNETLSDDLRERFGVEPAVVHNAIDLSAYAGAPAEAPPARGGERRIVFTGDIYQAHYDAFRNLMAALAALGRPGVQLHVYTEKTREELAAAGISGAVVRHPYLSLSEMPRVQMEADVLFLPLAFESPFPELVRTSAPTKLAEYLAARRPVLVHAPPASFPAWYFRRHECGVVVDERDPEKLAAGLARLLDDAELGRRLSANARERARADFDLREVRADFARLVGLETNGEGIGRTGAGGAAAPSSGARA